MFVLHSKVVFVVDDFLYDDLTLVFGVVPEEPFVERLCLDTDLVKKDVVGAEYCYCSYHYWEILPGDEAVEERHSQLKKSKKKRMPLSK